MKRFKVFLRESTEEKEEKLKHLEHPEDHFLNVGEAGFHHAMDTLVSVHNSLTGQKNGIHKLSLKVDGAPSIVAGIHPETKKFFVGTKSVFNKSPKVNYTEKDIDENHGHAPGLAQKLKIALKHLPKVIHSGIHQGDYIHDPEMRKHDKESLSFRANTVEHRLKSNGDEAKTIKGSKMGIAFHTAYSGNDLSNLKANYGHKTNFSSHPDVHVLDVSHDFSQDNYTPALQKRFMMHLQAANKAAKSTKYDVIAPHGETMKQYVNHTVRTGDKRTADGYRKFLEDKPKLINKFNLIQHVDDNKEHFNNAFKLHSHIEGAKNALVHAFNLKHGEHEFYTDGKPSKPEGFVAVTKNNRPTKLVDRSEFSRNNFKKSKNEKFS
jgi:hypothetical protein